MRKDSAGCLCRYWVEGCCSHPLAREFAPSLFERFLLWVGVKTYPDCVIGEWEHPENCGYFCRPASTTKNTGPFPI